MRHLLLFVAVLFSTYSFSQDFILNTPQATPLYSNPTFFQGDSLSRVSMAYARHKEGTSFETFLATASTFLPKQNAYAGIIYLNDNIGDGHIQTQRIGLTYAKNIYLPRDITLRIGTELSHHSQRLNWDLLTYPDVIDPRKGFIYSTSDSPREYKANVIDWNLGASLYWKRISVGFAYQHIPQPKGNTTVLRSENSEIPRKFVYNVSYDAQVRLGNQYLHIIPSFVHANQGNKEFEHFTISRTGLTLKYRGVQLGALFDDKSLSAGVLGYQFKNWATLTYSVGASKLTTKYYIHEFSMCFSFWRRSTKSNFRVLEGMYY